MLGSTGLALQFQRCEELSDGGAYQKALQDEELVTATPEEGSGAWLESSASFGDAWAD